MAITASDIKTLRENTGAGMLECKKALAEANGDLAEAEKILKEKGLAAMEKRSDRATGEGRIVIKQEGNKIAIAEVTCETDFVANNEDFIKVAEKATLIGNPGNHHEVTPRVLEWSFSLAQLGSSLTLGFDLAFGHAVAVCDQQCAGQIGQILAAGIEHGRADLVCLAGGKLVLQICHDLRGLRLCVCRIIAGNMLVWINVFNQVGPP